MKEKERNHNMDILRIFAMLCIICHHCIVNDFNLQGELRYHADTLMFGQKALLIMANAFVIIGVNVFFLLSGYFQIHFTMKKLVSIVVKVYLVFGMVTGIGIITGNVQINGETIKALLDPLDYYWYIITYLFLMIVSPLLNSIIQTITKRQYMFYVLGVFLVCCGYGFLHDVNLHINSGYSFLMAMVLYLLGGGIRKFEIKNSKAIIAFVVFAICNGIFILLVYCVLNGKRAWIMYAYNNPLIVLESVCLLIGFAGLQVRNKLGSYASRLAKGTLMVYLLHSTCWLTVVRAYPIKWMISKGFVWSGILLLPIYAILIYCICHLVDWVYEVSFGKVVKCCINEINKCIKRENKEKV